MNSRKESLVSILDQGYPIIMDFIFTSCPSFCPIISANFAYLDRKLLTTADPLRIVSISIDPDHDTPARLREYAKRYHASPRWQFYTGGYQDIISIQRAFDAFRGDKMNHEQLVFMRGSNQDGWLQLKNLITPKKLIEQYENMISGSRRNE